MATLRLTNTDRDSVITKAIDFAFAERKAALKAEESRIGMAAWEKVLPKAEREAALKLSSKWLRKDGCLRFRFEFRHVELKVADPVVVPSENRYCQDLGLVEDKKLIAEFEKLEADKTLLDEERSRAKANIHSLVYRMHSLRQLQDAWPEGKEFYAHLKPREEASVPAVQVEDLNRMLGLPVAA